MNDYLSRRVSIYLVRLQEDVQRLEKIVASQNEKIKKQDEIFEMYQKLMDLRKSYRPPYDEFYRTSCLDGPWGK